MSFPVSPKRNLPTPERLRTVLRLDNGVFYWRPRTIDMFSTERAFKGWTTRFEGKPVGMRRHIGYATLKVDDVGLYAHRVVWAMEYGEWPAGFIDHIDGDRGNNDLSNLRDVPRVLNQRNMSRCAGHTGTPGVYWYPERRKWRAHLTVIGAPSRSATFDSYEDAAAARRLWMSEHGFTDRHINSPAHTALPGQHAEQRSDVVAEGAGERFQQTHNGVDK